MLLLIKHEINQKILVLKEVWLRLWIHWYWLPHALLAVKSEDQTPVVLPKKVEQK